MTNDNKITYEQEITDLESQLAASLAEHDSEHPDVVDFWVRIADVHSKNSHRLEAESLYRRALGIRESTLGPEHPDVAVVLSKLANLLRDYGIYAEAEPLFRRALAIRVECFGADHPKTAILMSNLAILLRILGVHSESESLFRAALAICEKNSGTEHQDVATVLSNLANLLQDLGNYSESESCCLRALEIVEKIYEPEHSVVASKLTSLAILLHDIGRYSEAETYYRRALEIDIKVSGPDHPDVACVLCNLGNLLQDLGSYPEAERSYRRALEIWQRAYGKENPHVATVCNNLANLLQDLKKYAEAEPLYRRALEFSEKTYGLNNPEVAIDLNNLANLLNSTKRYPAAEPYYRRALEILEQAYGHDHADVALTMSNLASMLIKTGNYAEAEPLCLGALAIREKIYGSGHQSVASSLLCCSRLMSGKGDLACAVFMGKRAINILQQVRAEVSQISSETLHFYERKLEYDYSLLAEILIQSGRLLEAEHVIGLLKEDDYFDFIRRDVNCAGMVLRGISYNFDEAAVNSDYDALTLAFRTHYLRARSAAESDAGSPAEEAERVARKVQAEALSREFTRFLTGLRASLDPEDSTDLDGVGDLMSECWDLDAETAVIYTLSTMHTLYTILVTKDFRKSFSYSISSDDLGKKILYFRQSIMKRDKFDVEPLACELYDIILGGMSGELRDAKIKTLLWMLEGTLRLLPVCALHDGTQYIVNLYRNVYLTTKSRDHLQLKALPHWTALGMGVTQAQENFPPLPAVREELEGIVKNGAASLGIIPGEILLDDDFTWEAMAGKMDGTHDVVHIASHFNLDPCNEILSYLLLGDGGHLTLDTLKNQQALFRGVDLLALSACSTGLGTASGQGREIDGIGYICELQGAKTILATLWSVADESTSLLMTDFYRRKAAGASKIAALGEAQKGMLSGSTCPTKPQAKRSASELYRYEVDRDKPCAHPYYWAPFILIGNYR